MAVTFRGLTGAEGSIDYQGNHIYTRQYLLYGETNDGELAIIAALAGQGIATFQPHPSDALAKVTKVSVAIDEPRKARNGDFVGYKWRATVEYGPIPPNMVAGGPLAQPAIWRMDPEPMRVPAFVDRDGNPIVNTAGDFFDPPLEMEPVIRRLTVFRNEANPNLSAIEEVENKTNDAPWLLWDTGQVKALPIKIPERLYDQESQQRYYPMEYTFLIDPEGWEAQIINAGFGQLDSSGNRARIFDKSGQEITEPALLDEAGHRLDQPFDPSEIVILKFPVLKETDFTIYNLDDLDGLS